LNRNDPYTISALGEKSFSVSGDSIPEFSWVSFSVRGESSAGVEEIGFRPGDGTRCIEHFPKAKNEPPVVKVSVRQLSSEAPSVVQFDGSESYDPEGNELVEYIWDFGDGTKAVGKTVSHTYTWTGKFRALLKVSEAASTDDAESVGLSSYQISPDIFVTGDQPIGCRPLIIPTGVLNEYQIKAFYWHTNFTHHFFDPLIGEPGLTPVFISSGRITLSAPVLITEADAQTGIQVNESADDISFMMGKNLIPGLTESVRMTAVIEDIDNTYFTSCTFE